MALISNAFESLYNGVNQQAAEHRLATQVEEMINAYPTLDQGLLKRNPTEELVLDDAVTFTDDMWSYAYDRGLTGSNEEKYSINISDSDIEIINVVSGKVYKVGDGLTLSGNASDYIFPFAGRTGYAATTVKDTTFIVNKIVEPALTTSTGNTNYLKNGYLWLESANSASAYTYTIKITDSLGNTGTYSESNTLTTNGATSLAAKITAGGLFTATAIGSVIQISCVNEITELDSSDTWGNQASSAWIYKVQYTTDLPKNMGFEGAIVKVTGSGDNTFASFWLKYSGSAWEETKDPNIVNAIDADIMPHTLVRNADDTFTIVAYDDWTEMAVGDDVSNPTPSFMSDNNVIKDIFFFKNRLGFITERTVVLSEVGNYGNFWRTTTAAVLDSDYIDATVDTNVVVAMEYVVYLQDSVMLFSDKAQFKLEGGKVLSPKDVQISKTSAYEMNMAIRPIFMNDRIFFCSIRGDYTAVMEYKVQDSNNTVEAIDVTAHVQKYVPNDVVMLSGSPINNMLFLTSAANDDTVYVYKYYDNGLDRVQAAWFKWTFNGKIHSGFSLGKNFNLLIERAQNIAVTDWVVGSGTWDSSKLWDNSLPWVMSPASLTSVNQFETMPIAPIDHTEDFFDLSGTDNETMVITEVQLGEWVYSTRAGGKDIRGHLKVKTALITSEENSEFNLIVRDIARGSIRTIAAKYTVGRKPMIYGDANNVRISIFNAANKGFRINSVSLEGALTKRDKKL